MSTTITSLLNSLHTHLQSQTQLLPTLHAQLGLPPTALHDELSTLQQQLTQCIESQIDLRRKQVDGWMDKCALVEEECLRYGRALGGHLKSSGASVGEIRKEQVLPRRFELISEYQERLRQVGVRTLSTCSCQADTPLLLAIPHQVGTALESLEQNLGSGDYARPRVLPMRRPRAYSRSRRRRIRLDISSRCHTGALLEAGEGTREGKE